MFRLSPSVLTLNSYLSTQFKIKAFGQKRGSQVDDTLGDNQNNVIMMISVSGNNLPHQHGDMHITATVSLVQIYGTVKKNPNCSEKIAVHQTMSILVFHQICRCHTLLVIVAHSTNYV